jgi:hypothetical protein
MIARVAKLAMTLGRGPLLLGVLCVLQSCSPTAPGLVAAPPERPGRAILSLPALPGYPGEVAVVQALHVVRGDEANDVEAILQASAEHLVLVLSLPLGPRLAAIEWSARGIAIHRDLDLPAAGHVLPEDVLADIMLAFWPEAAVRSCLRDGLSLVVEPGRRLVMRDGVAVIEVQRDGTDPWNGRTTLANHLLGYHLTIVSRAMPSA